jgi:hypothetical protein
MLKKGRLLDCGLGTPHHLYFSGVLDNGQWEKRTIAWLIDRSALSNPLLGLVR